MKMLCVYTNNSIFKFPGVFYEFNYTCGEDNILKVFKRELDTGNEWEHAVFKEWNYYLIEEGHEI